jgi:DNA-binding FrmR family transcriptional regulator
MAHIHRDTKAQLNRINRVIGQLEAVKKKISDGDDCISIMQQLAASKGAINKLVHILVEEFVEHHLVKEQSQKKKEKDFEHFRGILKSYLK